MKLNPDGIKFTDDLERELIAGEFTSRYGPQSGYELLGMRRSVTDMAAVVLLLVGVLLLGLLAR